jgi:hypothetical protein
LRRRDGRPDTITFLHEGTKRHEDPKDQARRLAQGASAPGLTTQAQPTVVAQTN